MRRLEETKWTKDDIIHLSFNFSFSYKYVNVQINDLNMSLRKIEKKSNLLVSIFCFLETNDLSMLYPARVESMVRLFSEFAEENEVVVLDSEVGYARYADQITSFN